MESSHFRSPSELEGPDFSLFDRAVHFRYDFYFISLPSFLFFAMRVTPIMISSTSSAVISTILFFVKYRHFFSVSPDIRCQTPALFHIFGDVLTPLRHQRFCGLPGPVLLPLPSVKKFIPLRHHREHHLML
jgi:hypothetical protein